MTKEGETNNYKYVTIDSRILKYLVSVFNSTAIKIYCTLVWAIPKYEVLTYEWLANQVGLSIKGSNGRDEIRNILQSFYKVGLIEQIPFYDTKDLINGSIPIKCYKYKLNDYETFQKIFKTPRNKKNKKSVK